MVLLVVTGNARRYWDFSDYAIPIIIFTSPVWIFWSSAWIWPSKFDDFFNSKSNTNSKELKRWVYVDNSVAQTHIYYGVGGWAVLIIIGLILSPLRVLGEFYTQDINATIQSLDSRLLRSASITRLCSSLSSARF